MIRSIAAFQRSIVSADSRYDRYLQGKAKQSVAERRGMKLFMGERAECHHCHGSFIFNDQVTYKGSPAEKPVASRVSRSLRRWLTGAFSRTN